MLPQNTFVPTLNFLSGGGRMGEFVRNMDWSETSVGDPGGWPQSLRTSVSICLNSSSPLLIWWGKDLVKIYNDAYRDLIATKHPKAMGAKGADVWPEILPNVLPMLKGILKDGDATGLEDQLLIIERNGHSEVCYFTFSYSAIRDEAGNVGGIFCAVNETTKKVNAERKLSTLLSDLFIQAPVAICILRGENYIVEVANKMMLEFWGRTQDQVLNKPVFEALPEVKEQGFKKLLDAVYKQGEPFVAKEFPINLMRHGTMEDIFVKFDYEPLREEDGIISGIMVIATEITEQVVARKKVEASEAFNLTVLESNPDCVKVLDAEGRLIYMNKNGLCNMEIDDFSLFKNEHWWNLWGEENRQLVKDAVAKALCGDTAYFQASNLTVKGNFKWWDVIDSPVLENGDTKNISHIVSTSRDITEHKKSVINLEESEARFRNLVEKAPYPICILKGEDMVLVVANEPVYKIWNVDKKSLGKPFLEIIPEMKGQPFMGWLLDVFHNGVTHYGNEEPAYFTRKNGEKETIYFNFVYQPYRENDGTISGVMVLATDVTQQVNSRKKIEESEAQFRQVANLMPGKITNADAAGNVIYFNQSWVDYTGLTFAELVDGAWAKKIHPDDFAELDKRWQHSIITGNDFDFEFRLLNKTGEYNWHLSRASAVKEDNGKIKMWIGATIEIQKMKEEERQKDNFLSMASHELKTPVTTIKAYGQIAEMMLQENGDSKTLAVVNKMGNQIAKLSTLIGELLDFTKIQEGKLLYNEDFFDFNEFVKEVVEDMRHTTVTHKISYIESADARIFGDKGKLNQVVNNLISNGIKYSPNANKILVTTKLHHDGVTLAIQDYGIGIAKEAQDKVFDQFYRVTGDSQKTFPGMGIGLYICAEIIKREGGKIWVESSNDKGSVFCIWLPFDHRNQKPG